MSSRGSCKPPNYRRYSERLSNDLSVNVESFFSSRNVISPPVFSLSFTHLTIKICHSILIFFVSPVTLLPFLHICLSFPLLFSFFIYNFLSPSPTLISNPVSATPSSPSYLSLCLLFYLSAAGNGFFPDPGGWRGVLTVPNKEVTV